MSRITAVLGDIVRQADCDAIVNAANPNLRAGSGVCGAIHAAAGPSLEIACAGLAPVETGGAVITPGFALANPWVIHAVGPRYFDDPDPPSSLRRTMLSVLDIARRQGLRRVAVPAISTGVYGYPVEEAAPVMVSTVRSAIERSGLEELRFVLASQVALDAFVAVLGPLPPRTPVITRRLFEAICDRCRIEIGGIHGVSHWSRVRLNGLRLAALTGADPIVVELFAFLHDACRENEGVDPGHGTRAAQFVDELTPVVLPVNGHQKLLLKLACTGHTDQSVHHDPTVATCWDADRLDLWRIGIRPDPSRLCTEAARDPAVIEEARRRVLAGRG
jgi:uncharacterized protein